MTPHQARPADFGAGILACEGRLSSTGERCFFNCRWVNCSLCVIYSVLVILCDVFGTFSERIKVNGSPFLSDFLFLFGEWSCITGGCFRVA